MGAHFLTIPAILLLMQLFSQPASGQQFCLSCHPAHYGFRGGCSSCHRGNPSTDRKNIAHSGLIAGRYAAFTLGSSGVAGTGKGLLSRYACRRCHLTGGRGNRLASSLDQAVSRKTPEELAKAIQHPAAAMPDFRLTKEGETAIINALLLGGQTGGPKKADTPQVVHFSSPDKKSHDIFSRKCGPCHRLLSRERGPLGQGDSGPNLSGLLSSHYPASYPGGRSWTRERLAVWLTNPRKVRPRSLMRPVDLTESESADLVRQVFTGEL